MTLILNYAGGAASGMKLSQATTGFSPDDLDNLHTWYKADAITGLSDGDPVSQWDDESGNSHDIKQSTAGKKPTYETNELNGEPIVRFDGSDDYLVTDAFTAITAPITVFIVVKFRTSNATEKYYMDGGSNQYNAIFKSTASTSTYFHVAGSQIGPVSAETSNWHYYRAYRNGASSELTVDGGTAATGTLNDWDVTRFILGAGYGAGTGTAFADVDIAEVIVYTDVLTSGEISDIESYLSTKYSI